MTTTTRTRSVQGASTWALASVEGRRLVTHPAFLAGVALAVVSLIVNRVEGSDLPIGYDEVRFGAFFLAIGTLIAVNLNALRSRRHGADELYDAEPVPARLRTSAHLLSVLWAMAATVVLVIATFVTLAASDGFQVPFVDGIRVRTPTLAELALGPLVVGLFGVVGVLLARWLPSVAVALLALVAAVPYLFFEAWTPLAGPRGWFTPLWNAAQEVGGVSAAGGSWYPIVADFAVAALAWHELYLIGLIVVVSVLAIARHGWTRSLTVGAVLGSGAIVLGAVMQVAAATPWP